MTPMIERSLWLNAPRERVWRAITDPAEIQKWFSPGTPWKMTRMEVGGKVYAEGYEAQAGIIEVLDPPRQFSYRWDAQPPDPPFSLLTTYLLEEENGGTRLHFMENGFEAMPGDAGEKRADQNNGGWQMALANLKAYVEGEDLPFPEGL